MLKLSSKESRIRPEALQMVLDLESPNSMSIGLHLQVPGAVHKETDLRLEQLQ